MIGHYRNIANLSVFSQNDARLKKIEVNEVLSD